jgi:hypothetical protein
MGDRLFRYFKIYIKMNDQQDAIQIQNDEL